MSMIPFLRHHPQMPLSIHTNHNHRRPWHGLRILTLLLTITLGLGLIQPALAALVWQIQVVDSTGDVGFYSSLTLDSSGNPVISYEDHSNGDLKLVHCGDALCRSGNTIQTVDSAGFVGLFTSLALDSGGKPVISYYDSGQGDLKFVHCGDAMCSSGNIIRTLDSAGDVGGYTSLALDSSGKPVISYLDYTNGVLKVIHCGDATCSSGNSIQTVDSARGGGWYLSLALDSSDKPVISYNAQGDLKLVHCGDATCSSGTSIQTVDSAGEVGLYTALALDSSGNPVISYFDSTNSDLKVVHCGDANCSSGNLIQTVDSAGKVGFYTALALDSSGRPVISYWDSTNQSLKLMHCGDATCSSGNSIQTLDSANIVGFYSSLTLDSSNRPVISYNGAIELKLTRLVDDSTPPVITPVLSPATPNGQIGWYVSDVTVNFTCADEAGGSGLAINTVAGATLISAGANQSVTNTGVCIDNAGNVATPITVSGLNIDKTPPTLNPLVSPNPVGLGGVATVSSGATDSSSGLASQSCGALDTSSVGVKSVTCTATDNAGNTASATVNYTVAYPWSGFFQPVDNFPTVNTINAGQGIPVKFSLGGAYGLNIFASGYPKVQPFACGSGGSGSSDPIEETVTAGSSSLQYDPGTQSYTYIWKTDKSWAGSCRQLSVRLSDGVDHIALFQFNGKVRSADATGEAEVVQQIFLPLVNR